LNRLAEHLHGPDLFVLFQGGELNNFTNLRLASKAGTRNNRALTFDLETVINREHEWLLRAQRTIRDFDTLQNLVDEIDNALP